MISVPMFNTDKKYDRLVGRVSLYTDTIKKIEEELTRIYFGRKNTKVLKIVPTFVMTGNKKNYKAKLTDFSLSFVDKEVSL